VHWKFIIYIYGLATLLGMALTMCFVWWNAFLSGSATTLVGINWFGEMYLELVMFTSGMPCMIYTAWDAYKYRRDVWLREITGKHWIK
jgi:hypothetical protein